MDPIHATINLLNYTYNWFNQYILSGALTFIKAFLNLWIAVLSFIIDILRWIAAKI